MVPLLLSITGMKKWKHVSQYFEPLEFPPDPTYGSRKVDVIKETTKGVPITYVTKRLLKYLTLSRTWKGSVEAVLFKKHQPPAQSNFA